MPSDGSTATVVVDFIHATTDKAIQIEIDEELHWIPKSCITDHESFDVHDQDVEMEIATWILDDRNIDHDET